ncbi:MAG: SDR family oxidoreductase [Xanthomonadales bacterium]|nr:SDR family oxidoreductase [Xanthomonadales bacterium]
MRGRSGARWCGRLADAGARIAALDLAEAAGASDDPAILPLPPLDLADPEAARSAFARIGAAFGGLDGLCNLAGGFRWQRLGDGDPAVFDLMFRTNLRSAAVASAAALPLLADGRAAIVNVAALAALRAGEGMAAYAAAKAGVIKLTESLAEELKPRGIRVNAILPSIIDTPANRAEMPERRLRALGAPGGARPARRLPAQRSRERRQRRPDRRPGAAVKARGASRSPAGELELDRGGCGRARPRR